MIHTQLQLENVRLKKVGDGGYIVKLADLSRAQEGLTASFSHIERKYLAPEVLMGGHYTKGADIWSLGLILYQMCSLSFPFSTPNPDQIQSEITAGKHIDLPKSFSPRIKALLNRILQPDP